MNCHRKLHRVCFNECDSTGCVSISNYFRWFERVRFCIAEDSGIMRVLGGAQDVIFPVTFSECSYYKPITADAFIQIKTTLSVDAAMRLTFRHTVTDAESDERLAEGKTQIAIVSTQTGKVVKNVGSEFMDRYKQYIKTYEVIYP